MGTEELDCRDCTGNERDRGNGPSPRQICMEEVLPFSLHSSSIFGGYERVRGDLRSDAHSPPWTLPKDPSTSAADSRPTPLCEGVRNAPAQGGTTSRLSYEEPSSSSVEGGERAGNKRRRKESDASKRPTKNPRLSLMDKPNKPQSESGTWQGFNAQSFLQQVA